MWKRFSDSLKLFLLVLFISLCLHWSSNVFFSSEPITVTSVLLSILSGIVLSFSLPMIHIVNDAVKKRNYSKYQQELEFVKDLQIQLIQLMPYSSGESTKDINLSMKRAKGLPLFDRAAEKVQRTVLFLICFLVVVPTLSIFSGATAVYIRSIFSQVISAGAFGFVIYVMLAESE